MFGCLDWSHATETGNRSAFRDKRGIRSVLQTSDRVLWDATHTHTHPFEGAVTVMHCLIAAICVS